MEWLKNNALGLVTAALALLVGWYVASAAATELAPRSAPTMILVGLLALGASLAVIAIVRLALPRVAGASSAAASSGPTGDASELIRHKLAPVVVSIGAAAIIIIALAIIFVLSDSTQPEAIKNKIDTILVGIFSAILPVFATWVGTVLAFYYTSENLRQATQSARELTQGVRIENEPVTDPKRMIPYEKITKYVLGEGSNAKDAKDILVADLESYMKGDTISRIIIFSQDRRPVAVIRKKSLQGFHARTPAPAPTATLGEFLNDMSLAADAKRYRFVPASATVAFARQVLLANNVADIFITEGGGEEEPVKGWITDDRLQA